MSSSNLLVLVFTKIHQYLSMSEDLVQLIANKKVTEDKTRKILWKVTYGKTVSTSFTESSEYTSDVLCTHCNRPLKQMKHDRDLSGTTHKNH